MSDILDMEFAPTYSDITPDQFDRPPVNRPVSRGVQLVPLGGRLLRGEQPLNGRDAKRPGSLLLRKAKPSLAKPLRGGIIGREQGRKVLHPSVSQGEVQRPVGSSRAVERKTVVTQAEPSRNERVERLRGVCKTRPDPDKRTRPKGAATKAYAPWCGRSR